MSIQRDVDSRPFVVFLTYSDSTGFRIEIRDTAGRFGGGGDVWVMSAFSKGSFTNSLFQRVSEWEHLVGGGLSTSYVCGWVEGLLFEAERWLLYLFKRRMALPHNLKWTLQ